MSRRGADRLASGHPWVYASDVADRGEAQPGDAVRVLDPKGRPLGVAHYSSTSQITLRLLSPRVEEPGAAFFKTRLDAAGLHRRAVVRDTDAYRLVHAEGDLLPGLIIDHYAGYYVVQTLTQGMDRARDAIISSLHGAPGVVLRNDAPVRAKESLPLETVVLSGEIPDEVEIKMNGLRLFADLLRGQKTGIYLDQRENYLAAAAFGHGNALDCFTATGGFALHLAPRVERVEAIDSSAPALATARRNTAANGITNVDFRQADVFEFLSEARRQFSTIVLDPPPFAKRNSEVEGALRGYKEINLRALRMLTPGGILVTCSCSHHVSEAALLEVIAQAALDSGRTVRVLDRRTQSRDHPVLLTVPETMYLKILILQAL